MKTIEMTVGEASIINRFFSEVDAAPNQVAELVLVSPFIQLSTKAGTRLRHLLCNVNACGGSAILISDDTPSRRKDFRRAMKAYPDLEGALFLCKGLHAKCGLATNTVGNHVAFLGSANLTDAGLSKNAEVVFGLKGNTTEGPSWRLMGQFRLMLERIRSHSFELNNN